MKTALLIITIFLSIFNAFSSDTTNILFIGNSITYYNNMPTTFQEICDSKGTPVSHFMYAPGGASFASHSSDPQVHSLFALGNWDYVILQPNTNEALGSTIPIIQTINYCQQLVDSIYKHNPCTQVMLFENATGLMSASPSDSITYLIEQSIIRTNLLRMSDSVKSPISPIGEGYKLSRQTNQSLFLWVAYANIHPNAEGSYLDACVLYSSIFQSSVLGASSNPISPATANYLQVIADSIVLDSLSTWRINNWNQTTDFSFTVSSDTVYFTNLSQNVDSLIWDFGDNNFSIIFNPIHEYSTLGTYYVSLTTYSHGCEQSYKDTIEVVTSATNEWGYLSSFNVYPNPTKGKLFIETAIEVANVYDIVGKFQGVYEISNGYLDLSSLQKGIYILQLFSENGAITVKIIKE